MSTTKLGSTTVLRTSIFLLLALTPSFSLAQDLFEEIPKLQERIQDLQVQVHASKGRLLASEQLNARQELAYQQLSGTFGDLDIIAREFQALYQYKILASLITEQLAIQYAMRTVVRQRDYLKAITKRQSELIEKYLHKASDKETTRLLLEARDLFRSSVELLDRLQIPAP